ncbi:hypothetical protein [Candidatus Phytoplasma bonamiae]|uniref:Transmembrane protein n=1 Tax=Candidatus Phytoplasma bonamiae TaxID=2982626 RepID=A0ABT9D5F2_9MOLU|nr:hypothetical protein ['Bonamia sp.' little leaf phytoplasma]MDO8064299.1 hypothetical protein ['Bonamia sp.' little leaf phytoplasma]MDV3174866.1 hypothetical protein ['Bonamia sp.' little leaf phytoplasma]
MFEKSMKNTIIKLLIKVFMFFLLVLNIFLIILFNFNNKIKKSKVFSNKQINKAANLNQNNINLSPKEQKLFFIDNNIASSDEIIVILKERIVNQFLKRNKIAKALELANKDLDINFAISNNHLPIKDEEKFIRELIKIDPRITLKDDIIEELKSILLREYRIKKQLFEKYEFFINYKLIHNKMRNSNIYQINELYKNPQIQNIKYPFYAIVLKFILEDKEKEIFKLKEQLKKLQADFNYYNIIENRVKNEKVFENHLIAIDSTLTYQQNLLILKEKIKNQFKEKNQLAKLYDQIRTEIELSIFKPEEQLYIENEEDYINNFLFTSVNMPTSEEKILEHFQKILLLEYQNKKTILNLYSSYLKYIIDIMLNTKSNNFITWSSTKMGMINKIINNPLFTSFLRLQIEDAQNEIINLKEQIKDIPATIKNLEDKKKELQNDFQNQLKNYFITYDKKINDLKAKIEELTKNDEKHDKNDQKHDKDIMTFAPKLQTLTTITERHDESILDFDKKFITLTDNDERHDKNDQRHDENDEKHDKNDQRHDENDRIHDENDRIHKKNDERQDENDEKQKETDIKHDADILDLIPILKTLTSTTEKHDKSILNFDKRFTKLIDNDKRHDENDERHDKNDQKHDKDIMTFAPKLQTLTTITERHDESILDFDKKFITLTDNDERHDKNDQRHDENDEKHDKNDQRHDENDRIHDENYLRNDETNQRQDESIIDFDQRLKTLTEINRRQDESIIDFDQKLKTLTKIDQRQDESINKIQEKITIFNPVHTLFNEEKYKIQEKSKQNAINLNPQNQLLIKEKNKNNYIFQKNNFLSETINNKKTIEFLPYQQKNKIINKQQQLSLSQKLIKLAHKYLTKIYSINVQKWIFLFKKYSQIYLVIIPCMIINILFYLLLSNKFQS